MVLNQPLVRVMRVMGRQERRVVNVVMVAGRRSDGAFLLTEVVMVILTVVPLRTGATAGVKHFHALVCSSNHRMLE